MIRPNKFGQAGTARVANCHRSVASLEAYDITQDSIIGPRKRGLHNMM